jgi:DNA-binding MarR family transcriptional regulator
MRSLGGGNDAEPTGPVPGPRRWTDAASGAGCTPLYGDEMATPRWLDERQARVWRAHRQLNQRLDAALEAQLLSDAGLSGADYTVLVPLSEAQDGVLRARELGREIGWDRSRLSHQVRRMEQRGLVVREVCTEDARGSMVRLTESGRAAIEGAAPGHVEAVRQYFFDHLSSKELATLGAVLDRLLENLDRERDLQERSVVPVGTDGRRAR